MKIGNKIFGFHQTENMKLGVHIKMLSPKLSKSYYIM